MARRRPAARCLALVLLALAAVPARSSASAPPADRELPAEDLRFVGDWHGSLAVGGSHVQVVVHVIRGDRGGLAGTMDIPEQHAAGVGMDTLFLRRGGSIYMTFTSIGVRYRGALAPGGSVIRGTWTQAGFSMPLDLGRGAAPEQRRPQDPLPPYPYLVENVVVENRAANVRLAGTVTRPRGAGPFPAVLLLTGSGPQNRDAELLGHRPFLVLADRLTRAGFEVLRCDDRGVGQSSGDFTAATTADFASDARAELAYLRSRREVARARAGLLGHSEGGLIASRLAADDRGVAFVVLLSAPGVPGDSLLLLQGAALAAASGRRDPMVEWNRRLQRRLFAIVEAARDTTGLSAALVRAVDRAVAALPADQRSRIPPGFAQHQAASVSSPWFRWFLAYDPRVALRRIGCPVLALAGAKDLQVTPKENLAAIGAALRAGGNPDVRTLELPRLDHLLQTSATGLPSEYGSIEETIAPAALDTITRWLRAHAGLTR